MCNRSRGLNSCVSEETIAPDGQCGSTLEESTGWGLIDGFWENFVAGVLTSSPSDVKCGRGRVPTAAMNEIAGRH